AFRHALECWLTTKDFTTAVEKAVPWAKSARGAEMRDPDWLQVKLSAAEALVKLAESPAAAGDAAKQYLAEAGELASDVAKSNHPDLSRRGRMLLAQHTRTEEPAAKTVAFQAPEVKTFDEAFEKAEEAADEMKTT